MQKFDSVFHIRIRSYATRTDARNTYPMSCFSKQKLDKRDVLEKTG